MTAIRNVPFFNYKFFNDHYREDILSITADILKRGAFIMQQDIFTFEKRLAVYLDAKHVISVANCTDGLELAIHVAGIGAGDEVIFPSNTFVATASAIKSNGAIPVPAECGRDHLLDPANIEHLITDNTKAIMPAHLNGRTCNMEAIQSIANKYDLLIIEDAAQGLGSTFKGKKAGTFGLASAISFYPAKILGCLGDGGIVITNDDAVSSQIKLLRDHGRGPDGLVTTWGRNSRLDNLQAAILNRMFDHYEQTIAKRRTIAAMYNEKLSVLDDLILPPHPSYDTDHFDVFQNYEIECSYRDRLAEHLNENGIGTLKQWGGKAVHQMPGLGFNCKLPFTEKMVSRALLLPMNLSLTESDVDYVCNQIHHFYKAHLGKVVSMAS